MYGERDVNLSLYTYVPAVVHSDVLNAEGFCIFFLFWLRCLHKAYADDFDELKTLGNQWSVCEGLLHVVGDSRPKYGNGIFSFNKKSLLNKKSCKRWNVSCTLS